MFFTCKWIGQRILARTVAKYVFRRVLRLKKEYKMHQKLNDIFNNIHLYNRIALMKQDTVFKKIAPDFMDSGHLV